MNCCRIAGGLPAPRSNSGHAPNRPSRWRGQTLTTLQEFGTVLRARPNV
jgi:hypothetical protein